MPLSLSRRRSGNELAMQELRAPGDEVATGTSQKALQAFDDLYRRCCNNFYVAYDHVFRPDSPGKPVVVLSNNDGCAIPRSSEADISSRGALFSDKPHSCSPFRGGVVAVVEG